MLNDPFTQGESTSPVQNAKKAARNKKKKQRRKEKREAAKTQASPAAPEIPDEAKCNGDAATPESAPRSVQQAASTPTPSNSKKKGKKEKKQAESNVPQPLISSTKAPSPLKKSAKASERRNEVSDVVNRDNCI